MASTGAIELNTAQALTEDTVSAAKSTELFQTKYIASLIVSAIGAGTTVGGTVEHSPDGSNWFTLATFDNLTTTGGSIKQVTDAVLPFIRSNLTVTGGAETATVTVRMFYDKG